MSEKGRVLAVFAHPDDETYGPGATLARLSAEGSEVRLITLTRGESASLGASHLYSPDLLAEVRERELGCACRALGISHYETFSFPDKALETVPYGELAAPVIKALEEFRPHLVITFEPEGISGHQDHRVVSKTLKRALDEIRPRRGGGPEHGTRLAYYVVPESAAARIEWRRILSVPDEKVTHAIEIGPFLEAKAKAAQCHKTQLYMYERLCGCPGGIEEIWRNEYFIVEGEKPGRKLKTELPVGGS